MIHRVFSAEVQNGQLRFDESLADLEGHRGRVVLDDDQAANSELPLLCPSPMCDEVLNIDEPVDFERPFRRQVIVTPIRDGGRLTPCLIFDEEAHDE